MQSGHSKGNSRRIQFRSKRPDLVRWTLNEERNPIALEHRGRTWRDEFGIVMRDAGGRLGSPGFRTRSYVSHPVSGWDDWPAMRDRFDAGTPGRYQDDWDCYGEKVIAPVGTFYLSAHGAFQDSEPSRIERRYVRIRFRPAADLLKDVRRNVRIQFDGVSGRKIPSVAATTNLETPEMNNAGMVGQIIKVRGERLSFDPADDELGVFLVAGDRTEYRMQFYSRTGTS